MNTSPLLILLLTLISTSFAGWNYFENNSGEDIYIEVSCTCLQADKAYFIAAGDTVSHDCSCNLDRVDAFVWEYWTSGDARVRYGKLTGSSFGAINYQDPDDSYNWALFDLYGLSLGVSTYKITKNSNYWTSDKVLDICYQYSHTGSCVLGNKYDDII